VPSIPFDIDARVAREFVVVSFVSVPPGKTRNRAVATNSATGDEGEAPTSEASSEVPPSALISADGNLEDLEETIWRVRHSYGRQPELPRDSLTLWMS